MAAERARAAPLLHCDVLEPMLAPMLPGLVARLQQTLPSSHTLLVGCAALVSSSCFLDATECGVDEVRCNENGAEFCFQPDDGRPRRWSRTDCGAGFCHMSSDSAQPNPFCATTAEPEPRCTASAYFEMCDANRVMGCHQGYVEHTIDCTTGETFNWLYQYSPSQVGYCVGREDFALCAIEPNTSPECLAQVDEGSGCRGDTLLICNKGYVVGAESCPGACVSDAYPYCALATAPDPACPPGVVASYCRDGTIEHCRYGWVTYEERCSSNACDLPSGRTEALCL